MALHMDNLDCAEQGTEACFYVLQKLLSAGLRPHSP